MSELIWIIFFDKERKCTEIMWCASNQLALYFLIVCCCWLFLLILSTSVIVHFSFDGWYPFSIFFSGLFLTSCHDVIIYSLRHGVKQIFHFQLTFNYLKGFTFCYSLHKFYNDSLMKHIANLLSFQNYLRKTILC